MQNQFEELLKSGLKETGTSIQRSTADVAAYAAQRTAILATLVGLQGYDQAVIAERDNIALYAGLKAAQEASNARQVLLGIIQGALFMAAGLL